MGTKGKFGPVPTIKIHGRMVVQIHRFLTSALVWIVIGQFHAPIELMPRENAPFMHWIWGWMEPTAGLDACLC